MKVSALYLSYNSDLELLSQSVSDTCHFCDHVYVYDNFSKIKPSIINDNCTVIYGEKNIGVSGLNYIMKLALENGSDFVLIIDQDSLLPSNFISDSLMAYKVRPGVYAPFYKDRIRSDKSYKLESIAHRYVPVEFAIGSGLLLSKEIIETVGYMDESFFLDCVDIDYCFRLNEKKIPIIVDRYCKMEHSIGDDFLEVFTWTFSLHSPFRHYLYYKNSFSLIVKTYTPLRWKVKQILKMNFQWFIYSVFSKDKLLNFKALPLALIDCVYKREPLDRLSLFS
ncbi:hypothetical protein [Vibrio aestuarianus]|uniref:hypothetical protein n=1 Tax=Vibrio aestuarianus TaxID=28171 RepID=UPI00237CE130|nr:hypothetical protein [Vibrio aestuarianus]MDE1330739.1 hypothetical protein [Vibrio aestuarianus]